MKELVEVIAKALVDNPDEVVVTEKTEGKTIVVEYNGAPGPMTDYSADAETLCKMNEEFYANFLETINKMF